ncbi:ABC transporter substrate-binding protein [Phormidium tenue FACHB-1052]|nr:ABC transporter substrate-binding protein [Phormidium tenue FACHB-1052]
MGWLIASCASQPSSLQPSPPPVSSPQKNSQRLVAHALGNTAVPSQPLRVVVLTNEATDMVLALGLTPVGAVKSWSGEPYYAYLADAMAEVPVVGDEMQPSLEQIVALKPDLILGSEVRQGQIYGQCEWPWPSWTRHFLHQPWQR